MDKDIILNLKGIDVSYGSNHVLDHIDLTLEKGKFYVLFGVNGAGKSTLINTIARQVVPEAGEGTTFGFPFDSDDPELSRQIGYVSETVNFNIPVKLREIFKMLQNVYGVWDEKLCEFLVNELELDPNKLPGQLSRGQKMRLAFIAAICIKPKLLLLDEFTSVLDIYGKRVIFQVLKDFVREGKTVLFATNILSEVEECADHLILLNHKHIAIDASMNKIGHNFVKLKIPSNFVKEAVSLEGLTIVGFDRESGDRYALIPKTEFNEKVSAFKESGLISPEDVFIYFTQLDKAA